MSYSATLGRWLEADPIGYADGPNLYQADGGSPVSKLDPTGLYNAAGHYMTVYILAMIARNPDALDLAYWAQFPDLSSQWDAIGALTSWPPGQAVDIQNYLHSLTIDPVHRRCILNKILNDHPDLDPKTKGVLLHALGDTYAHTWNLFGLTVGFVPPLGHSFAGHAPDYIGNNPQEWQAYVYNLFNQLGGNINDPTQLALLQNFLSLRFRPVGALIPFSDLGDLFGGQNPYEQWEENLLRDWAANHNLPSHPIPKRPDSGKTEPDMWGIINMIKNAEKQGCCDKK